MYAVVRGWAIPPYKVGRRFGPGTPHDADMVKIKTAGEAAWLEAAWLDRDQAAIEPARLWHHHYYYYS